MCTTIGSTNAAVLPDPVLAMPCGYGRPCAQAQCLGLQALSTREQGQALETDVNGLSTPTLASHVLNSGCQQPAWQAGSMILLADDCLH